MSVESRLYVGLTIEFARNLKSADFKKCHEFTDKHPELDESCYHMSELEGKLVLVGDGMNGDFLRLIYIDKVIDGGCLGDGNDFYELAAPKDCFNPDLIKLMTILYEEYTGRKPENSDFKYAMWNMWY